jgi:hypothetical protein
MVIMEKAHAKQMLSEGSKVIHQDFLQEKNMQKKKGSRKE